MWMGTARRLGIAQSLLPPDACGPLPGALILRAGFRAALSRKYGAAAGGFCRR
jgi:hypothetical protein